MICCTGIYLRRLPPIWAGRSDLFVADDRLHLLDARVLADVVKVGQLEVLGHPVHFASVSENKNSILKCKVCENRI